MILMESFCHRKVPSLKKTLGGQKAFHERFVLGRSKAFVRDSNEDLELATFEFVYIGNFTCWIQGRDEYITPIEKRVNSKLHQLSKTREEKNTCYFDKLAYLTFMSGVCDKLLGRVQQAKDKFESVIDM